MDIESSQKSEIEIFEDSIIQANSKLFTNKE